MVQSLPLSKQLIIFDLLIVSDFNKHGCDRTSAEVYDVTDDAETRSIILLNDESIVVSSVSASELNKRFTKIANNSSLDC